MAPRPEWLTAALEHQRAGRFAEAERICDAVLGANPAEADALHLLGLIAASRDQYELAGTMFARAITCKPNRADFYASLGNLFFSRGLGAEMADCYRRALLLAYFSTIPAPYAEIIAHAGSDPPASNFKTNLGQYKSQYLQDILLDRWLFGGLTEGIFVDIGAHDGVTYSNSFFSRSCGVGAASASNPTPPCSPSWQRTGNARLSIVVSPMLRARCLSSRFPVIPKCFPASWKNTSPNIANASNGSSNNSAERRR